MRTGPHSCSTSWASPRHFPNSSRSSSSSTCSVAWLVGGCRRWPSLRARRPRLRHRGMVVGSSNFVAAIRAGDSTRSCSGRAGRLLQVLSAISSCGASSESASWCRAVYVLVALDTVDDGTGRHGLGGGARGRGDICRRLDRRRLLVFWSVEGRESVNAVTDGGGQLCSTRSTSTRVAAAPRHGCASAGLRRLLPGAVHPRQARALASRWAPFASPLVAFLRLAAIMWRIGVRHYRSPGADGADRGQDSARRSASTAGEAGAAAIARSCGPSTASRSRSRPARWSATSGRTAPASPRRSRC